MKKCDCKSNVKSDGFPEVQAGDTVRISQKRWPVTYHLVCRFKEEMRLVNLESGVIWSYDSLFECLSPSEVTKIDLCYSEH